MRVSESEMEPRFRGVVSSERDRPLAMVFGWAGASDKNLDKYAEIYRRAGCDTLSYYLPTRFIFSCTADVPHVARRLADAVKEAGLDGRPVIFHNLSDTGLMVYQGLRHVAREDGKAMDVRASIMDSCPGPRPEMNLGRVTAMCIVNYICSRRDGVTRAEAFKDSMRYGRAYLNLTCLEYTFVPVPVFPSYTC